MHAEAVVSLKCALHSIRVLYLSPSPLTNMPRNSGVPNSAHYMPDTALLVKQILKIQSILGPQLITNNIRVQCNM